MNDDDIRTLALIARGDGELRVSKRLVRDLIAKAVLGSTGRVAMPPHRIAGSAH